MDSIPRPSQLSSYTAMSEESEMTRILLYSFFMLVVLTFYGGQV